MSKAVFNGQVEPCCAKQAMRNVFQSGTVHVVQLVGGGHLHVGQQTSGIIMLLTSRLHPRARAYCTCRDQEIGESTESRKAITAHVVYFCESRSTAGLRFSRLIHSSSNTHQVRYGSARNIN